MALTFISNTSTPNYMAVSSDIVNNKISGASIEGKTIYLTDLDTWKIVTGDTTLDDYYLPVTATVTVNAVQVKGSDGTSLASVDAANSSRSTATKVLSVQVIDSAGTVVGSSAKDAGPSQTYTQTGFTSADASATPVDLTADPGVGLKAKAMDIIVSVATACTVNIITESGSTIFSIYMGANSTVQITPRGYIKGATAHKKLQATTSVTSAISGLCNWFTEA